MVAGLKANGHYDRSGTGHGHKHGHEHDSHGTVPHGDLPDITGDAGGTGAASAARRSPAALPPARTTSWRSGGRQRE